jgi:hypothetical protein
MMVDSLLYYHKSNEIEISVAFSLVDSTLKSVDIGKQDLEL